MKPNIFLYPLLIITIVLNVGLFDQAKKYYFELNQTRLDPNGLEAYPIAPIPAIKGQTRVVFFGDSRAAAWSPPSASGYEFINRGISGQTSTQTIQRFQYHVRPLQPQIVIIQVGINDLKTIALFPDHKDEIIKKCQSNIEQIIQQSNALGATVVLTTIFPTGDVPLQRQLFWSKEIGLAVNQVNRHLLSLANDRVIVLDTFPLLANQNGLLRSDYRNNELHLNQQGYDVLNQELVKRLKTIQ